MADALTADQPAPDAPLDAPLSQRPTEISDVTLITGASSGIGLELAKVFAAGGDRLVLVGRDESRLHQVVASLPSRDGGAHLPIATDLAMPGAIRELVGLVEGQGLTIETLVNNAGGGVYGRFVEADLDEELEMLRTNVLATTELTGRVLPGMVARGRGRILNTASTLAFMPSPRMAAYGSSKAYVLSFTEALAQEVAGTGVTVTALCPGATKTRFAERAGAKRARIFRFGAAGPAAPVARAAYDGLMRGDRIVIPGLANQLNVASVRLLPRRALTRMVAFIQAPA